MTTELLIEALLALEESNSNLTADEQQKIKSALNELVDIENLAGTNDAWKHEVYFVHADAAADFMNVATYDDYGKLYVEQNGSVDFNSYASAVHKFHPTASHELIELGYDIVSDLYAENEQQGCHKPDGTFDSSK